MPSLPPRRPRTFSVSMQRRHGLVLSCQVCPQVGQRFQNAGSGLTQRAHKGSRRVPPRTGAMVPHPLQRVRHCWHRSHHGCPVAREISPGAFCPQMLHSTIWRGRHETHQTAAPSRAATGRRRPQPAHSSRLAGSLTRQFGQSGLPSPSRVAGSRTAPHREQGTAACRAKQFRQTRLPSSSFDSALTWPHREHAGLTTMVAPASASAPMNRSTAGAGASLPSPVSRPGRSRTAQAIRRCPAGRMAACWSAACTASAVRAESMLVTRDISSASGSPSSSGQSAQRARPRRSRLLTRRCSPQTAQSFHFSRQGEQPQSPPRAACRSAGGRGACRGSRCCSSSCA
jgi:hypothetical protein